VLHHGTCGLAAAGQGWSRHEEMATTTLHVVQLALNCACLGGSIKTPLGVVSFAKNLIMAAMGSAMLSGG
jgi:hypothetical protein